MRPTDVENTVRRKESIIEAASELFANIGFEETTIKAIAKRAGLSTGIIFYYFPRKIDIVNATVEAAKVSLENDSSRSAQRALELIAEVNHVLTTSDTDHLTATRILIANTLR